MVRVATAALAFKAVVPTVRVPATFVPAPLVFEFAVLGFVGLAFAFAVLALVAVVGVGAVVALGRNGVGAEQEEQGNQNAVFHPCYVVSA